MASELRRRALGKDTSSEDADAAITPPRGGSPVPAGKTVKIVHHDKTSSRKRKFGAIFLLGGLFGIVAAGFFAKSNDLIDFPDISDLSMDTWLDVLPDSFVKDLRDMVVCCLDVPSPWRIFVDSRCSYRKASAIWSTPTMPSPSVSRPSPRA